MKVEKNKIVFATVLAVILIFLISYSVMIMGNDESDTKNLKQTLVPKLQEEGEKEYDTKLDAINDLKEVRETNAPSIYDDKLIDSMGFYDPDLKEKEKQRIVDSIYSSGQIKYSERSYQNMGDKRVIANEEPEIDSSDVKNQQLIEAKEMGLEQQLFFASAPSRNDVAMSGHTDATIYAVVDGDQVVRANSRLRMRLAQDANINGRTVPKNTLIFGFISFQSNRALIQIENIQHRPTKLKAFDLTDGSEGIYVVNSLREEVSTEALDELLGDINIPSVPQVSGITKIFQHHNRKTKATIINGYRLILKPKL
ncbi:conjugative transposon protein TraM [Flavobacteriaceae bacterium F89]|uniref:Conjugative transposon protein TraM n=1 Tax=Cerina litoralis TaxID=2874477 RepID=A0AAE3F037_9FLAO|nr:conjugative transposon protein TraM [Cerina litoralis]MCG2462847.1 conjugative transposon protein TraM [Cerina litoralis]